MGSRNHTAFQVYQNLKISSLGCLVHAEPSSKHKYPVWPRRSLQHFHACCVLVFSWAAVHICVLLITSVLNSQHTAQTRSSPASCQRPCNNSVSTAEWANAAEQMFQRRRHGASVGTMWLMKLRSKWSKDLVELTSSQMRACGLVCAGPPDWVHLSLTAQLPATWLRGIWKHCGKWSGALVWQIMQTALQTEGLWKFIL